MLHVLPPEVTLSVLSHLPIPSLLSLPVLSRQWFDFLTTNQSEIFHSAALLHEYVQPGTLLLEDALSVNTGRPWAKSMSWKDFCHRSFQLGKNWEGRGLTVARVLSPPGSNVCSIKVDEKAGICITTHFSGGLSVIHLFSSTVLWCLPQSYVGPFMDCEYDNGYLVFYRASGEKEVWRLASDFSAEGEVSAHSPPDGEQMRVSACAATAYHQYSPRGHFRPWALLSYPEFMRAYRLAYPTLICAGYKYALLHDVHTGALVQTIEIRLRTHCYVDVNERHAFVCEPNAVRVFSRESGCEVLRIPADAKVRCSRRVEDPDLLSKDKFITPLSVCPKLVKYRPWTITAHIQVSRDGRDLVLLYQQCRVVFIRDFERICRGETSLKRAGLSLKIGPPDECTCLGFDHGRVCVATLQGLYIFTFGPDLSAKAVFVRPFKNDAPPLDPINCLQLTDRHIFFTWENARRRRGIPLFEDTENAQELPPSIPPTLGQEFDAPLWVGQFDTIATTSVGCIDFSLMPEGYASEI